MSENHTGLYVKEELFCCDICDAPFKTKTCLNYHKKRHNENYKCEICGKFLSSTFYLAEHMKLHTGEKPFQCSFCGERFISKKRLIHHLKVNAEQDDGENSLQCTVCKAFFLKKGCLDYHKREHARQQYKHVCRICGKVLSRGYILKTHIRLHTGETPFQCKRCPASFPSKINLNYHIFETHDKLLLNDEYDAQSPRDHSSVPTGRTNIIEQDSHLSYYKSEVSSSLPDRNHQCSECGKAFVNFGRLKVHERKHTGVLPHECLMCHKRFRRMRRWKCHVITALSSPDGGCIAQPIRGLSQRKCKNII